MLKGLWLLVEHCRKKKDMQAELTACQRLWLLASDYAMSNEYALGAFHTRLHSEYCVSTFAHTASCLALQMQRNLPLHRRCLRNRKRLPCLIAWL